MDLAGAKVSWPQRDRAVVCDLTARAKRAGHAHWVARPNLLHGLLHSLVHRLAYGHAHRLAYGHACGNHRLAHGHLRLANGHAHREADGDPHWYSLLHIRCVLRPMDLLLHTMVLL